MRVLVCGGRYYDNADAVHHELIGFHWRIPITVMIHGGVSGAGAIAEAWARRNRVAVVRYPPNWECLGKRAEKLRNDFMLADSRPDFVIAFPGGRNTADLVAKASAAGLQVLHAADYPRRVGVPGDAETTPVVCRHRGQTAVRRIAPHRDPGPSQYECGAGERTRSPAVPLFSNFSYIRHTGCDISSLGDMEFLLDSFESAAYPRIAGWTTVRDSEFQMERCIDIGRSTDGH